MIKYVDTIRELMILYAGLLVVAAGAYSFFESVPYLTAFWWACVTGMTVGYGDIYPVTIGGKVTSVLLMHSTVLFILPLLIGRMCTQLIEDRNEFTHEEQESMKQAQIDMLKLLKTVDNKLSKIKTSQNNITRKVKEISNEKANTNVKRSNNRAGRTANDS